MFLNFDTMLLIFALRKELYTISTVDLMHNIYLVSLMWREHLIQVSHKSMRIHKSSLDLKHIGGYSPKQKYAAQLKMYIIKC